MVGFNTVRPGIYVLFSKLSGPLGMVTIASVKINRPVFGRHTELHGYLCLIFLFFSNNTNSESLEIETN